LPIGDSINAGGGKGFPPYPLVALIGVRADIRAGLGLFLSAALLFRKPYKASNGIPL
jgi:hypothetical protein